jgi:hypothetical protein
MPIEVRELVIKATVVQDGTAPAAMGSGSPADGNTSSTEEIIKTCVDKVLEILKDKNER